MLCMLHVCSHILLDNPNILGDDQPVGIHSRSPIPDDENSAFDIRQTQQSLSKSLLGMFQFTHDREKENSRPFKRIFMQATSYEVVDHTMTTMSYS